MSTPLGGAHIFKFSDMVSFEHIAIVQELMTKEVTLERTFAIYEQFKGGLTPDSRAVIITIILNATHSASLIDKVYDDLKPEMYYLSMIGISPHVSVSLLKKFSEDKQESMLSDANMARLLFLQAAEKSGSTYQELPVDWIVRATSHNEGK